MEQMSLKNKLLLFVTTILLLSSVVTTLFLWNGLQSANRDILNKTREALTVEVGQRLAGLSGRYGEQIATYINQSYRVPATVASMLSQGYEQPSTAPSRAQLEALLKGIISKESNVSSIYTQFEANSYHDKDSDWIAGASHSVKDKGSLEIYFTRSQDGTVTQQIVDKAASDAKYDTTLNEFGIRNAEWYLCGKDTLNPCLMEPYLYEISPGYKELMTSLTVPILRGKQFVGIAGVDINLPLFQQQTVELGNAIYSGKATVLLLSNKHLIIGSNRHPDKLGRPLSELAATESTGWQQLLDNNDAISQTEDAILARYPITVPIAHQTWFLLISIPKATALHEANVISSQLDSLVKGVGTKQILLGSVITLFALVMLIMLLSTIAKPLRQITSHVAALSSAEGDLTQRVEIHSHAELIDLSKSLNKFITKLRDMVAELKSVEHEVSKEAVQVDEIASRINNSVAIQHREIDSVVTAMHEMSTTANDVARYAAGAASEAERATNQTQHSQQSLAITKQEIQHLASEMSTANRAIAQVAASSDNISKILDVIRAISEQTNLLALNAAIEAARAGEMGRGFAVVADEVRALANKTRASTDEISQLITTLQKEVHGTSNIINTGVERAEKTVQSAEEAYNSLLDVVTQIHAMFDHITQVATAAEEQSSVSEEINQNLSHIGDAAADLTQLAINANEGSERLQQQVGLLEQQLGKLRT